MTPPRVSLVIVSHERADALRRCLAGVAQLAYPALEVIVVCDAPSRAEVRDPQIKTVLFDEANISAARNRGIAQAAGEIVAFIDDDAVPEPTWLTHLTAPFADESVSAAGGYVIGRNGISFQWTASMAFADGRTAPLPVTGTAPVTFDGVAGEAIKTEGTNMAFRRSVLLELGGFDEAYRFYLDETDLNMRLAAAGHRTAIVPLAQVHHGFAASARRTAARIPRDLKEIGASSAVFAAKFGDAGAVEAARYEDRTAQRRRLLRLMVRGDLMPGDVRRLLKTFDEGWAEGTSRNAGQTATFDDPPLFQPITPQFKGHELLTARFWQAGAAQAKARDLVAQGKRVTLLLLSLTAIYHRVRFTDDGIWEQRGGQFGRSDRGQPLFQFWTARGRTAAETARIAETRDILSSESAHKRR